MATGTDRRSLRQSLRCVGTVLFRYALARTTTVKYNAAWRQWSFFSRLMGWSPWFRHNTTTITNKLCYFAIYLWRYGGNKALRGNKYSTIRSKLSSILWYQRRYRDIQLLSSPKLQILLKGIRRLSEPVSKKQPVTPAFLRLLRRSLDLRQPRQRLLWGSVFISYFFLLQRSEYLVVQKTRSFYCLKFKDVYFADAQGRVTPVDSATAVSICLSGAKNDQFGRGALRTMHRPGDPRLCPVLALKHIHKARRQLKMANSQHLCLDLDSTTVDNALKRVARKVGATPSNYASHSLRSGGATALLRGNVDSLAIKLLGRRTSRCFEEYLVQSELQQQCWHGGWSDVGYRLKAARAIHLGAAHHPLNADQSNICPRRGSGRLRKT